MTSSSFTGKVVLITGGGSGIGRATAMAFARAGATVVVAGRNDERLQATVDAVQGAGGRATSIRADISDPHDVKRMVTTTVREHRGLHVAFNNAGVVDAGPLADIDDQAWERVVSTNVTGTFLSMKHEIRHMRANGGGTIVNTASTIGAHVRIPFLTAYATTKAAVSVMSRSAAREYIQDGVRINAISPGPIDTPMSLRPGETENDRTERMRTALPIGRVGSLDEVAAAVLWLASPESSFAVGQDLILDGGATA